MTIEEIKELNVGQKVYKITSIGILEAVVLEINDERRYRILRLSTGDTWFAYAKSKKYFKTKELAEKYLKDVENNKEKKKKMYEYEKQLNEEYGLETFLIKY